MIESKTTVRVQTLPRPPENLKATEITPTSVKLSWSYPGKNYSISGYVGSETKNMDKSELKLKIRKIFTLVNSSLIVYKIFPRVYHENV